MRIKIVQNQTEKSNKVSSRLKQMLLTEGFEVNSTDPEIIISIGGDGTLLSAFHRYAHMLDKVRFIGVHTGHLGFYTDWREFSLEDLVEGLKQDNGEYVDYPLLDVEVTYSSNEETTHFLALNESSIKRIDGTLVCDIYIKNERFERFRGDGLCISTPTGSTGYNKSLGGAIIHPRLEALQLTEIASLNNRVFRTLSSPMIIAPDEWIKMVPINTENFSLAIDQLVSTETDVKEVRYRIANERIRFARYEHLHFWDRVEDAFIGVRKKRDL